MELNIQAPELDRSVLAPESCPSDGLQVHQDTFLQIAFDREPPYPIDGSQEQPEKTIATSNLLEKSYTLKQTIIYLGAFIVILGTSLGIGLGLGLLKGNISSTLSDSGQNSSTNGNNGSNSSAIGILPDTSLGAITTTDGNKHIFFQDTSGGIRQIIYYEQEQKWFSTAELVIDAPIDSPPPRSYTPLAALSVANSDYQLFYIDTKDFIRATSTNHPLPWLNNSLLVASDTRTLSITSLVSTALSTDIEAGLFYEAPSGDIKALHGSLPDASNNANVTWNWTDVSGPLYSTAKNVGAGLGAPFGATVFQSVYEGNSSQELQIQAFNPGHIKDSSLPVFCQFMFSWGAPVPDTPTAPFCFNNTIDQNGTDFLSLFIPAAPLSAWATDVFAWVVNETLSGNLASGLTTHYPYGRLAWLNTTNTSSIHIYHQLDAYTLVEDTYVNNIGWETTNITVTIAPDPAS